MNLQPLLGEHLASLWQRHPLVFFHLATALGALLLGSFILARRKGTGSHRALGWLWVALMGSTALATAFIRDYQLPNVGDVRTMAGSPESAFCKEQIISKSNGKF